MRFQKFFTPTLFLISLLLTAPLIAQEKLIFAIDMIRHGDRTPYKGLECLPYEWDIGLGQLTPVGLQQEFELGQKLRQQYIEQNQLLASDYQHEQIYARSTDVDRTLMSASALLLGLYPSKQTSSLPGQFHPIPIHTKPREQDSLSPWVNARDAFTASLEKHIYVRPDWQANFAKIKPKLKKWNKVLGVKIEKLQDILDVSDALYIHRLHGKTLPNLSAKDIDEIIALGEWTYAIRFEPKEIGLFAKPLHQEITQYFEDKQQNKSNLNWVLLSAHDSTLMTYMSLLGAPEKEPVPYASRLNIALYDRGDEEPVIAVHLNDKPVHIPECGGHRCTMAQWKGLVG